MHPHLCAQRARALALRRGTLGPLALLALALLAAGAADARLVDDTPPGGLRSLYVDAKSGHADVVAALPEDDDVTQARFVLLDAEAAVLAKHYAPAGPGETVTVRLPVPPGAAVLHAGAVDGEGNAGPVAVAAVDGRLGVFTLEPKGAPLPALVAAGALAAGATAARRR